MSWLPPAKIAPPAAPEGWLRRALPDAPVLALVAGPGYGKSLALRGLALAAEEAGAAVVWYAIDEDDADPATFFRSLVAALRRHVPPFGQEVLEAVAGGALAPRALWARLFEALAAYALPGVTFVFDDVHRWGPEGEALAQGLAGQLEKLPPGVRVALASRRKLPFPLARLTARGVAAQLGPAQLRFDAAEEAAFVAALMGEVEPSAAWLRRATALEGWPQGLAFLAALPPDLTPAADRPADELSAYLAEEVVAALPADRQAFARRAALLETPTAALVAAVFGDDAEAAQAALAALEADHLAQRLADGAGFRLPGFLRDHLLAELAEASTPAQRAGWHRAAAAALVAAGEAGRALPHLVAAGDWAAAAAGCHAPFAEAAARGRQALVERWLAAFPAEAVDQQPILGYWRGFMAARAGRSDEATAVLERVRAAFAERGDAAWELKATVKLASLALFGRDAARFGTLIMRALALVPLGNAEDQADLQLIRALAAEQRGDMALMRECNEAALAVPIGENVEVATCAAIAQLNLYTAAVLRGDVEAAERHATAGRELAEAWDLPALRLFAGFLLCDMKLVRGELEAAGAFVRGLAPRWEDALDWHDRACGWIAIGRYHQVKGSWAEAERAFGRTRAIFERAGFAEGVTVAIERQLWLAVRRGQPARALFLAGELPTGAGEPSAHALACALPAAQAHLLAGDPAACLAALAAARPGLERHGARLHLARLELIAAAAHAAAGDAAAAAAARAAVEAGIAAHGYGFLRHEDPDLWARLSAAPAADAAAPATPAAASTDGAAAGVAAGMAAAAGEAQLVLRLFGEFEVVLGDRRLDAWPRRKAKLVLAALALAPNGLTTYELAELLADQERGAAAVNMVQVSVFALRRILEPALGKGAASRFVTFHDERYRLAPELLAPTDLAAFDRAIAAGRRAGGAEAAAAFAEAMALYRGDLLEEPYFLRWFEAEREGYRADALAALAWLADHHAAGGDEAAAEAAVDRAAAVAPTDEDVVRRAIAFHAARRRPERVRRLYWDFRKALKARLGFAPDADFDKAFERELARASAPA